MSCRTQSTFHGVPYICSTMDCAFLSKTMPTNFWNYAQQHPKSCHSCKYLDYHPVSDNLKPKSAQGSNSSETSTSVSLVKTITS